MVYDFFEELKDIVKEKIKYFYGKFKYVFLLLILVILVLTVFLCKAENPENIESQQIYFLDISLENWSLWIAIITIPYAAGWTIFQFKKNSSAKKQEKAVEIAKEFSETFNFSTLLFINNNSCSSFNLFCSNTNCFCCNDLISSLKKAL